MSLIDLASGSGPDVLSVVLPASPLVDGFHIDMVTIVFVMATIDILVAIFGLVHARLTRNVSQLTLFILGKFLQGISWSLRIVWFDHRLQLIASTADFLLVIGNTFEFWMLTEFARPHNKRCRSVLWILTLALCLAGGVLNHLSSELSGLASLAVYLALMVYAVGILFFTPKSSRFQRFLALFYFFDQTGILGLSYLRSSEVMQPGYSYSFWACVYYAFLLIGLLLAPLGYLLMVSERDKDKLIEQATRDSLTGIMNRRAFFTLAEKLVSNAIRNRQNISVIVIDLDHFKQINDSYGHAAGDAILLAFTRTVQNIIRVGDAFARFGGDEFLLLLPNCDRENALYVANRILADVNAISIPYGESLIRCSASLGISTGIFAKNEDLSALIATADTALYSAKEHGRNQVSVF